MERVARNRVIPVFGVVSFVERITNTSMACREDAVCIALHLRRIQLEIHQLVHVLENQHVPVKLDHALILDKRE